jgi:DNA repair exonuclease SbcCD ATPase subunit
MAKKKLEKRKFIEGILNLQVFSDMLTDVRSEYNSVVRELDIECVKYEEVSNSINTLNVQKQNAENEQLRAKNKLNSRKESCQREMDKLMKERDTIKPVNIDDISSQISNINDATNKAEVKVSDFMKSHTKTKTLIEVNQQKLSKMSSDHHQCPVCLHEMDDTHRVYIDQERGNTQQVVKQLTDERDAIKTRLTKARSIQQQLVDEKNKLNNKLNKANLQRQNIINIDNQIKQLKTQFTDIADDVKSLKNWDNTIDKQIEEVTVRLESKQQAIDVIKKSISRLDVIKFVVSEEGVKSYIVKKILQLLNSKLAYYLKKMDSNCICVFNEYFEEEIIDEKGKPCSYFNFSGAERKNIDLACLFAFMDIRRLQGDVAFNFSMYDELFDSSLDERGVELVIEILKERIDNFNECVMVISHRKESTKMATGEIIFLEKQNGVTTRVETPQSELK